MFDFIITIYYCRYYCVVHAELSFRIDVHMFRVDCVQPGRTLLAPAITVSHVPALLWNLQLQGAPLCQWLPADWENSAAIKQVMANIFQIKFRLQHIRSLRRALSLSVTSGWKSGLSSVQKKSFNPTFNQRECVHPLGRAAAEEPDGWRLWHSASPDPGGAEESCFLGALRSSNGPQWTPQEIIELRRSRPCPQGAGGFIYFILAYFSFRSGSKRRKSIRQNCDIFPRFLLVHLWQHSGYDGVVQSLYSS